MPFFRDSFLAAGWKGQRSKSFGFKSADILGQAIVFTFLFLGDFSSVLWIVMLLEYSFSAKLLETGSHLVSQYFGISASIRL